MPPASNTTRDWRAAISTWSAPEGGRKLSMHVAGVQMPHRPRVQAQDEKEEGAVTNAANGKDHETSLDGILTGTDAET